MLYKLQLKSLLSITLLTLVQFISKAQQDYSPGFDAGQPKEMERLLFLEGVWEISLKWTDDLEQDKAKWHSLGRTQSTFSKLFNGVFVQEESAGFPLKPGHEGFKNWEYISVFSFDRFQNKYRYVAFDNILGLADIYEAKKSEGVLTFSNQHTTTYNNHGTDHSNQKNKFTFNKLSNSSFEITWYNIDESELKSSIEPTWDLAIYMLYEKISD